MSNTCFWFIKQAWKYL